MTWVLPSGRTMVPRWTGPTGFDAGWTVNGFQTERQAASVQMNLPFFSALRL